MPVRALGRPTRLAKADGPDRTALPASAAPFLRGTMAKFFVQVGDLVTDISINNIHFESATVIDINEDEERLMIQFADGRIEEIEVADITHEITEH